MKIRALMLIVALGAIPAAHADTGDCGSPCSISTAITGYTAPVEIIKSGTSVKWTSADSDSHPTSDKPLDQQPCFFTPVGPSATPVVYVFKIASGKVTAKTGTITKTCGTATALPNGDQVLPFQCNVHGWMRGELLIHP